MNMEVKLYKKDVTSLKLIEFALKNCIFFKQVIINMEALKSIINTMTPKKVSPGSEVTQSGETGNEIFVCASGYLNVLNGTELIKIIGPGEVFGEGAFLSGSRRKTKVVATTECQLWVLKYKNYSKIIQKYFPLTDEDYISFFKKIPLLRGLSYTTLIRLSYNVHVEWYESNMPIITAGEEGNDFFIITGGKVQITVTLDDGKNKILGSLGEGDFFGEGAILRKNRKRTATVTALAPGVECLVLDGIEFGDVAVSCIEEMSETNIIRNKISKEVIDKDLDYQYVTMDDLEVKGTIALGFLGSINIVQSKKFPELVFALKTLKKAYINKEDFKSILSEKIILMLCRNYFIIRLYKTFKDERYLYFMEEACLGGDLKQLMKKNERNYFDEKTAKFYAACIIEALDYLHSRGIVYGNLKAENLVIDLKGYLKLVGFGKVKSCRNLQDLTHETFNEIAENPERFKDYQLLGVFIYEMLVGSDLWAGESIDAEDMTCEDMNEFYANISYPKHIPKSSRSIIRKLLKKKFDENTSTQKTEMLKIKEHRWFQYFEWSKVQNQTMKAPYIPSIQNNTDLSNFESPGRDKDIPPKDFNDLDNDF